MIALAARRHAPATLRNRDAILAVLREALPPRGLVLEVASGSGEHACHFAAALPGLDVQPSDPDPLALASIDGWAATAGLANLRPALLLDATAAAWPVARAAAVLCCNMIHIAPWAATLGLLRGAAAILPAGAPLLLYGPFKRDGQPTAPSNLAFDAELRAQDSAWGLRNLAAVRAAAADFHYPVVVEMPANNLSVIFRRK
jgi:hypothetical protein